RVRVSGRFLRWPIAASFVGHAAVLGGLIAYETMQPEPPPKPVEIVMAAVPTSMDALSMKAEETAAVQPDAAQTATPVETATPAPVEAAQAVPVETVPPVDTAATPPPPPPAEVKTAKAEEIPLETPVEQVAAIEPAETRPVEERVETVARDVVPPAPKPPRPIPPRPRQPTPVAAKVPPAPAPAPAVPAPVADAPPAPPSPAPVTQTAMLSAPAPRPARPSGPSQSYLAALRAQLERYKTYPPAAQRRRMEGTTTVRFTIARNGAVLGYRIVGSSGHSLLDREVEELLQRASPLPALPADVDGEQLEIVVPISFYLR
uniref:energy transducer TonB n=1 Tax=Stella sp. TaxID=2912054 RepID=UPI0035AE5602